MARHKPKSCHSHAPQSPQHPYWSSIKATQLLVEVSDQIAACSSTAECKLPPGTMSQRATEVRRPETKHSTDIPVLPIKAQVAKPKPKQSSSTSTPCCKRFCSTSANGFLHSFACKKIAESVSRLKSSLHKQCCTGKWPCPQLRCPTANLDAPNIHQIGICSCAKPKSTNQLSPIKFSHCQYEKMV